jgi:hypothetical protein
MKMAKVMLSILVTLVLALNVHAQKHPQILDVSEVTIGAKRLPTKYLYAVGVWSDAPEAANGMSTQIECYKVVDHCVVVSVIIVGTGSYSVGTALDGFDILRWDDKELIAVDSSPICVVNTIRADFVSKTVTISSSKKATEQADKDTFCKFADESTAVLVNSTEKVNIDLSHKKK